MKVEFEELQISSGSFRCVCAAHKYILYMQYFLDPPSTRLQLTDLYTICTYVVCTYVHVDQLKYHVQEVFNIFLPGSQVLILTMNLSDEQCCFSCTHQ